MIKLMYDELFQTLISTINGPPIGSEQCIAILDIAGFGTLIQIYLWTIFSLFPINSKYKL